MNRFCDECDEQSDFVWLRSMQDDDRQWWEIYICPDCGHDIEIEAN